MMKYEPRDYVIGNLFAREIMGWQENQGKYEDRITRKFSVNVAEYQPDRDIGQAMQLLERLANIRGELNWTVSRRISCGLTYSCGIIGKGSVVPVIVGGNTAAGAICRAIAEFYGIMF